MSLTQQQMDEVIARHFEFERTDDVDGVVSTLSDDVTHDIVGWPTGPVKGPQNARKFYEALFPDIADGHVKSNWRLYGDNFVVDESYWQGRAVGRPFGFEGKDRMFGFRLLHVFEFDEAGDIKSERVWLDYPDIARQLS